MELALGLRTFAPNTDPGTASLRTAPPVNEVEEAAKGFESLLVGQIVRMAQESGTDSGWLGTSEEAGRTLSEFAETFLSQAITDAGGLGLSPLIARGLQSQAERSQAEAPAGASASASR